MNILSLITINVEYLNIHYIIETFKNENFDKKLNYLHI